MKLVEKELTVYEDTEEEVMLTDEKTETLK